MSSLLPCSRLELASKGLNDQLLQVIQAYGPGDETDEEGRYTYASLNLVVQRQSQHIFPASFSHVLMYFKDFITLLCGAKSMASCNMPSPYGS